MKQKEHPGAGTLIFLKYRSEWSAKVEYEVI